MNPSAILCPLDFSSASAQLVVVAALLAASSGAELRLLYVQEPHDGYQPQNLDLTLGAYQAAAEAAGAGRVRTQLAQGEAAQVIVAEARRQPTDLIVLGAHGQTNLSRFLMGNTAEVVMCTAPCPTLLVHK